MVQYLKRNLEVVRGTKEEIDNIPAKDMTLYLAWDTNQIFVGNSNGVKTPYNGEARIINWVESKLKQYEYDSFGVKGEIILSPYDLAESNVIATDGNKLYTAEITTEIEVSDWIDIRYTSRRDYENAKKVDLSYSVYNNIIIFYSRELPEENINFEFFIMKGI